MACLRLSANVSFGVIGSQPVFLDLGRDRYLTLGGDAFRGFERLRAGDAVSEADAQALLATGLFAHADQPAPIAPAFAPIANRQLDLAASGRDSLLDKLAAWHLLRKVGRELRSQPLHALLARRAACPRQNPAQHHDQAAELALRFGRARRSAPVSQRCLPNSIALWDWLSRRGTTASIVFGVKLDPFGAHCWVQQGDLVLNEAVDRAGEYTPVFVFS